MLILDIPDQKLFNDHTLEFIDVKGSHLEMEHSLESIQRWESKHHRSFLNNAEITPEEFLDYCRCMTVNKPENPDIYPYLRKKDLKQIAAYMNDPMSARFIREKRTNKPKTRNRKQITCEYYYWAMAQFGIPYECAKWHFNQLLALLDAFDENGGGNDSPIPMNYRQRQQFYRELNNQRRAQLGSKG